MPNIFVNLSARALGDFATYVVLASSIVDMFDDGVLYVCYRADRPYKDPIVSYLWNAKSIARIPGDAIRSIPIESFDNGAAHREAWSTFSPLWDQRPWQADIILTGKMLDDLAVGTIPTTMLSPPPAAIIAGNEAMLKLGVDPDRWVAAIYWKAADYKYRGHHQIRTIYNPEPYIEVIRHITEDLGGQVVRLGHASEIKIPSFKGFFDLAKIDNSEWLQLYAVSISRFFIGSGSGPIAYGSALGVPTAVTDQNLCLGVWHAHDYIVTQNIRYNGQTLSQIEAYDAGILHTDWAPSAPVEYVRNTAAQLIAATDEMYEATRSCNEWRYLHDIKPVLYRPNSVTLPLPRRYKSELLIPPSLRSEQTASRAASL